MEPRISDEERRRLNILLGGGSVYDDQPVWLRWVIGIALVAWFVPPTVLVFLKMVGLIGNH
jgi:hypothetical protein